MAKKPATTESVYRLLEVIGTGKQSREDAAKNAVGIRVLLSFKYES